MNSENETSGSAPEDENEILVRRLKEAARRVYATEDGRLLINSLLETCLDKTDICVSTKSDGSVDPLFLANAAGRQYVAHHIRKLLEAPEEK